MATKTGYTSKKRLCPTGMINCCHASAINCVWISCVKLCPPFNTSKGTAFVVKLSGKVTDDQETSPRSPKSLPSSIRSVSASA